MKTILWAVVLWPATYMGSLSAQIHLSVKEGSSAVLPCDWRNRSNTQPSSQIPHIEWRTISETVFERLGEELFQGEGYEERVDVPKDKLLNGDCSLVLKNIRLSDAGPYESYLLEKRNKRALRSRRVFIQSVELSVEESSEESAAYISEQESRLSSAGVISVPSQLITFTILTNMFS